MKKILTIFAALTLSVGLWAVDWSQIEWLGNGSGISDYSDKYKASMVSGIDTIVNIQMPGFATKPGIYVTVTAGISDCSLGEGNFDIQGSGIILHLDAFTKQETEVTITYSGGTGVLLVYYKDGSSTPAPPTFTPEESEFEGSVEVTLTAEEGARIYYTLDGSRASCDQGLYYTAPFTLTATTTVKAVAFKNGKESENAEKTYTLLPPPATVKVAYLDPVYNDPTDVTKGIKEWKNATADAIEITDSSDTLAAGWYVVNGADVQTSTLVCEGEVHLILADGAKLTATGADNAAGIQVFDEGNSLIIYGQTNQTGELIANGGASGAGIGGGGSNDGSNITINGGIVIATSKDYGAGIGGGELGGGSNIIINGGTVTATGGAGGAGIGGGSGNDGSNITINGGTVTATGSERIIPPSSPLRMVTANGGNSSAGIGGGVSGDGSNITINGGIVTATGGNNCTGIGGGDFGSGSDIFVATSLVVKADNNNPPTTVIANDGSDLASSLAGKRYATVETPAAPEVGDTFEDATSGLKFEVTATGETNTVKVIAGDYTGITFITIPPMVSHNNVDFAVTEIGEKAFYECLDLQNIIIPESVTTIGKSAFEECSDLTSITLPASLTTIEDKTFYYSGLQSITIPEGVTTIGEEAFVSTDLQSITIPASVTSIRASAFGKCSDLTSVTFKGNACQNAIGENAFLNVGSTEEPATLVLPGNWMGSKPAQDGSWYGGYFKIDATGLFNVNSKANANKFFHNGQLFLRQGEKTYNALGQEL